jgi:hypothetical protein
VSTPTWAATSPALAGMAGVYCENCDIAEPTVGGVAVRSHRGRRRARDRRCRTPVDGLRTADRRQRLRYCLMCDVARR